MISLCSLWPLWLTKLRQETALAVCGAIDCPHTVVAPQISRQAEDAIGDYRTFHPAHLLMRANPAKQLMTREHYFKRLSESRSALEQTWRSFVSPCPRVLRRRRPPQPHSFVFA
jgi:hypothetical protein